MPSHNKAPSAVAQPFNSQAELQAAVDLVIRHVDLRYALGLNKVEIIEAAHRMGARLDKTSLRKLIGQRPMANQPILEERPNMLVRSIVLGARECFEYLATHTNSDDCVDFAVPTSVHTSMVTHETLKNGYALDAAAWRKKEKDEPDYYERLLQLGFRNSKTLDAATIRRDARRVRASTKPAAA